jgi:cation:H+ antiporter
MMYVMSAAGLIVLLLGGDFLVRGAVSLAHRLDISTLIIGLTVVALGTSAPELVVSVEAVLAESPGIAIGNVVGSNIANVLMVLGLPALVAPILCEGHLLKRTMTYMLMASALFVAFCWMGRLDWWHGVILLILFVAFILDSYFHAMRDQDDAMAVASEVEEIQAVPGSVLITVIAILGGLVALMLGSYLLVEGASAIARSFGISESVIGLTLVAIGTSLPELATCIMAAIHKHGDVAIGNVIGSNLFNILAVMGTASVVGTIPVPSKFLVFDFWIMLAAALLLLPFVFRGQQISRSAGIVFIIAYGAFVASQFLGFSGVAAVHS